MKANSSDNSKPSTIAYINLHRSHIGRHLCYAMVKNDARIQDLGNGHQAAFEQNRRLRMF